ncbi:hypothetical protein ACFSR7_36070 [Cohnella sp. GCM10020058]|uniref:hypothetical protein n=1 Tax=Cohnella sp. GCM10020058 TaxID=3317330 RepID=UPI0036341D95
MYPISALYDRYLRKPDREFIIKAEIQGVDYDQTSIVDFEIENSLTINEEFLIGTTTFSKLTMHVRTPQAIPQGAKIKPYISLGQEGLTWAEADTAWQNFNIPWNNGQAEWLPLGEFYVDQREQINSVWTLICYDKLVFSEEAYLSSLSYPATMKAVWDEICTALGYVYDSSVVINPAYTIAAAPVGYTKRQVLGYIASANSASVFVGKDGTVKFKRWSASAAPVATFSTSDYVRIKQTNPIKTYTRIVMPYDPDDADAYYEAGTGDDGHTLYVSNPFATKAICNALYAALNGFSYMPVQMDSRGYPQYEQGDIIGFQRQEGTTWADTIVAWQDANFTWDNIVTYQTIMLHTVLTFRGGLKMTVEASAKSEQASEYEQDGPLTQEINRVNQTAVKQGKLYYGVSINKEEGLVINRSDNLSKVVLNSDEFTMWAESEKALWFDAINRRWKFTGTLEGADGIFTGTLQAGTIISADIHGGTIDGTTVTGTNIIGGTVTGTNIYGSYIATSNGSYPRAEMSNTANAFVVYSSASSFARFIASASGGFPALDFTFGGVGVTMYGSSSLFNIDSTGIPIRIGPSGADMNLVGNTVTINNVDVLSLLNNKASISDVNARASNLTYDSTTKNLKLWAAGGALLATVNIAGS